jgi:hypothetical protein
MSTTNKFNKHNVYHLPDRGKGFDPIIRSDLEKNGWMFVQLPTSITEKHNALLNQFSEFFGKKSEEKNKLIGPYGFGYSSVPHKEGVRYFTGNAIHTFFDLGIYPKEWIPTMWEMTFELDNLAMEIMAGLAVQVFEKNHADVAKMADIPVAYSGQLGMLDIAHYFNKKTSETQPAIGSSTEDVNCVPHYDPGLLSFSFLSTTEGLQLFDQDTQTWVDGPVNTEFGQRNIGVIWLGEAAIKVDSKLKAGVHRVIYPKKSQPRITAWYEICTIKQASEPEEKYVTSDSVTVPNLPGSAPISNTKGKSVSSVLQKIERVRGVPRTKIIRLGDTFKNWKEDKSIPTIKEDDFESDGDNSKTISSSSAPVPLGTEDSSIISKMKGIFFKQ